MLPTADGVAVKYDCYGYCDYKRRSVKKKSQWQAFGMLPRAEGIILRECIEIQNMSYAMSTREYNSSSPGLHWETVRHLQ